MFQFFAVDKTLAIPSSYSESNSQLVLLYAKKHSSCSEYQRYTIMKAIHNGTYKAVAIAAVVQNIKDIQL